MLLDLDRRIADLEAAGIYHQAIWMDATGYPLPGETGARWSRLYSECLAESLREPGPLVA